MELIRKDTVATKTKSVVKPRALKPGDCVGLVCPSSRPETPGVVTRAQRVITEMGFVPVAGKHVLETHGFMAGTDEQRLFDLQSFLNDDSIAAVYCITGGYGALHLVPHLEFSCLSKNPKLVIGCDDNTALLNAIYARCSMVTMHAPNLDQVKNKETFERVRSALTKTDALSGISASGGADAFSGEQQDFYCAVEGTVEGRLIGGNLTSFAALLGTSFEPDMKGSIIFLEDLNEQNGILDRWFTTLYLGGHLQFASGVAVGSFENCSGRDSTNMLSVMDTFSDRLKYLGKTSCFGLPFGQQSHTTAIPIGIESRLIATEGKLEFLEPALSR
jgi:muramoyltetrapeptide carboxypeptidase